MNVLLHDYFYTSLNSVHFAIAVTGSVISMTNKVRSSNSNRQAVKPGACVYGGGGQDWLCSSLHVCMSCSWRGHHDKEHIISYAQYILHFHGV